MKKKILFIIWSLSYGGGAEKILCNIVNNLNPEKYDIEVMEYLHADKMEQVDDHVKILPPIIDTTKTDLFSQIRNKIIDKLLIKLCPGIIRKWYLNKTYDVEISFNYLIPTFLLNRKSRSRIAWIHGSVEDLEENPRLKKKQRRAFKYVDKIVAISNATKQSIVRGFPEYRDKVLTIYNGYNLKNIRSEESVEDFDLLYCNRFDENKNPMRFVQIIKELRDTGMRVTAKMLGTGPLVESVRRKISEDGLEEQIEYIGYKKNPYAYFEHCRIFCLTSFAEGFPTTLVEAMYWEKPFVSTKVAGTDELSHDGSCGIVATDNGAYAEGIRQLLSNTEKYRGMSLNCRELVKTYAIENQIKEVEKCIDSL